MRIVNQIVNIDAKPSLKKVLSIRLYRKRGIIDAAEHGEIRWARPQGACHDPPVAGPGTFTKGFKFSMVFDRQGQDRPSIPIQRGLSALILGHY